MDEVKWAFKLFLASILIVAFLQVKVGQATVEEHLQDGFQNSWIAKPLQKVVDGGVAAIKVATRAVTQYINQALSGPEPQRASRLNLSFDRSESAIQSQKARASAAAQKVQNRGRALMDE